MKIKEIRELVEIIKENDLLEFELEEGEFSIRVRRGRESTYDSPQPGYYPAAQMPAVQGPDTGASAPRSGGAGEKVEVGVELIESPMVGTFYRAPSPESQPFVSEGDSVSNESIVCIIEAMKVMNEIQAERKGKVLEVLAKDGEAVEFGQPLFKVKTS